MRELVAATTDRTLAVEGFGTFRVPPPSVRAAVTVLSVQAGGPQAEADREALCEVCAAWLPLRTYSVVFSNAFSDEKRLEVLRALLTGGLPVRIRKQIEEERQKAEAADEGGRVASRAEYWQARVAQYRAAYSLTMEEVLAESFFAWVPQLRQLSRLEARMKKRHVDAGIVAQGGDEGAYEQIADDARWPGQASDGQPEVTPEWEKDEDDTKEKWLQRKMKKAAQIKRRSGHRGRNDLS